MRLSLATFGAAMIAMACATAAQAQDLPLSHATVRDLNAAFASGRLSSEALVRRYLARIDAYDQQGPALNAVLWVNQAALERARELDRERTAGRIRSPLHGIPVLLKDNVDTHDMPTTAGSVLLAGSIPPDDAFIVQRLRDAGAIVLAKLNMSEFASGVTAGSLGGFIRNPHAVDRSPSGSSGGTGVAIAASYGQVGIGTDTGGSIRGPSTANGIVGLKPTHGLLSRDGIIPLALSFDMAGPMGRHVYDVAAMLSVMTGVDSADPATNKSEGRVLSDYTAALDTLALRGVTIGVARDFMGQDGEVDWIMEAALQTMRDAGATTIDIRFPAWFNESRGQWYTTIRWREFRAQIPAYLATIGARYPKTLSELVEQSMRHVSPDEHTISNPTRWSLFMRENASGDTTDAAYRNVHTHVMPLIREFTEGLMDELGLDAIVYPTSPTRPGLVNGGGGGGGGGGPTATNIANLGGLPDLSVPAGFTSNRLPVNISFLGRSFSEATVLALGYAFEQRTRARRDPVLTPPLAGEAIPR